MGFEEALKNYSGEQLEVIMRAHAVAEKAHEGQMRESGEPYIIHPESAALILANMGMDYESVCAALLHDVVEDTALTEEDVTEQFGKSISDIVAGVTKLNKIQFASKEEAQAENLRRMFLAMSKDIRVIFVKLADRLHNMQTLDCCDESKQRRIAKETLDIYAPLANRLGIYKIKWRLEDLCLKYLEPDAYKYIDDAINQGREEREQVIASIIDIINTKLKENNIDVVKVYGRPKHYYSIYRKMCQQKSDTIDNIYDLSAVRIIVTSVRYCYEALGIMHSEFIPMPGRFKDYIAMPKANMYQSLHTTVIGKNGNPFEIQIRTEEMHNIDEFGVAAHWKYKEGKADERVSGEEKLSWLRRMMDPDHEANDNAEYMDVVRTELFNDEVFVFTPKGDVKNLPVGATPLDFAYSIHSSIGHRCIGAKINGKIVNIDTKLKNGDIIEILTASATANHGPSRDWLNIVCTNEAKSKIKGWFKRELRDENIEKGKDMLDKEAHRQGYSISSLTKPEWLASIIKKYKLASMEDLYASIGYGALRVHQILPKLIEEYKKTLDVSEIEAPKTEKKREKSNNGVIVKGESNMLVRFARCCSPVPGDEIVGYITRGRGVSVHRRDCTNLGGIEREREIEVAWDLEAESNYVANVQMHCYDRSGMMLDISNAIYSNKSDIGSLNISIKEGIATANIGIRIHSGEQLEDILRDFRKICGVIDVYRMNN